MINKPWTVTRTQNLPIMTNTFIDTDLSMYTILIVDDIPVNVILLQTMLSKFGIRTVTAKNGEEALNRISETKPDLMLLDIKMPVMDGFETLQAIKSNPETSDIKVVMVTAFTAQDEVRKAMDSGACGYLTKPIMMDDLLRCVTNQLKK